MGTEVESISLDLVTYRRLVNYARFTGNTPEAVADEAIEFFMDTFGDSILEELERREIEADAEAHARDFLRSLQRKGALVILPAARA